MTETLVHGYSSESTQREQSNEYQHDRVRWFSNCFASLCLRMKVAFALEGLRFPPEIVIWYCDTFDFNFEMEKAFTKYLKES